MRWLVWRPRVVWFDGWWAVSRDRPWLGVAYVWAMLSDSDLSGKCIGSVELEIHSDGRVLGIGHVTVWSSHIEYGAWWFELLVMHVVIKVIWVYPCGYYRCYIIYHYHTLLIMALLIFLSPPCLARWDLLSAFVLTCLLSCFYQSVQTTCPRSSSRRHPQPSWSHWS
jgi:hypothetical protein